ncbi:polypyrimidine tract-binding protein homolog 2 isoform X1 [Tanacetum coccineum]
MGEDGELNEADCYGQEYDIANLFLAVVNDGFQTSFGESTLLSTMNPSFGSKVNVEEGGNGDSSIAIPTSSFPSLAEVSRFYTNSGGESRNKVHLVPSMFDTNSKSICGMEGITPTGWTFSERNDLHNKPSSDSSFVKSVDINIHPTTYAGATGASNSEQLKSKVNFRPMVAEKVFDDVNMSIPRKVVKKVSRHFENTLYGYFISKQMAFPIVEYYARNNWAKHGLKRIMMNSKGLFFFKFDTRGGLEAVLEGGPWMIYNSSIILKKWSISTSLLKEELTQIPIWVKLHDVPLQVFKDDGISLIASYLGKPIMLDSYTSLMCKDSWGRSSFARCLIEINSATDFKESITIGIPDLEGPAKGFQVGKEFNYQPRAPSVGSNGGGNRGEASSKASPSKDTNVGTSVATKGNQNDRQEEKDVVDTGMMKMSNITTPNPFAALDEDEEEEVVNENNLSVCAILESHVDVAVIYNTCKKVCDRWKWTSNGSLCPKDNYYVDRRALWNNLVAHASLMRDKPWELKECVQKMEVMDVNATGLHFTWNQKPKGYNGILKKIDRIMGDLPFTNDFPGNLHERVNRLHVELDEAQKAIDCNPSCSLLRDEHALYLLAFIESSLDDERFLRKKSKIEWLNAGDSNTAYFHKIVKSKCVHNRIEMVTRVLEGTTTPLDDHRLFSQVLSDHNADFMVREVSDIEIKGALFSIGDDKPPGPDGFNAAFFKKSWDIVGDGSSIANHGFLTSIVRFIANRIKGYIGDLVSINQSAFVSGHRISDNILLTQELMRNYHRKRGPPRCAFKVDIQKAYDTVDWGFLRSILVGFGFHPTMVDWIMVCVTTTSYSISINGDMHGWFNGKRGLKQGDPLSPYLFTLVMEVLTLILQRRVQNAEDFQYHHLCEQQRIVNLCFVDDIFLFARGHPNSVRVIMDALEILYLLDILVFLLSLLGYCTETSRFSVIMVVNLTTTPYITYLPIKQLMRGFLWCQGEMKKGKAKVAWEAVRIEDFNIALMATHIWSTSMWFDRWADPCLLRDMLTVRNIVHSDFSLSDTVSDLISNGSWRRPHDWSSRFPNDVNIPVPDINNDLDDVIVWRDVQGVFQRFSVAGAWDSLWLRADVVDWYHVVWFPHYIPRHAIHIWLVIKEKLKTQDRLRQWDVWFQIRAFTGMSYVPPWLVDVLAFLIPTKGSSVSNVISRIVLAAMTYCLWNERNSRLFKKKKSTAYQIVQLITSLVRMKLVTFKFKKMTTGSRLLLDQWKIPSSCFSYNGSSK